MAALPIYIWVIVLIGVLGAIATMTLALRSGAIAAGLDRNKAIQISATAGVIWAIWATTSAVIAGANGFRPEADNAIPWIGVAVAGSLGVVLLCTRVPVLQAILARPGVLWQLTLPQIWRPVGLAFLLAMALGKLPAVFALLAGLGDIAVGLSAMLVARNLRRGEVGRSILWFNLFGLADLVVAIGIGYAAGLGPNRLLMVTPSTEAITLLPLVLIVTAFVPLAAALHVLSLVKLRQARRVLPAGQPVASAV
jgi:hypothetical protein